MIRDDSRKSLLKQLCYALVTNGRNDHGGTSKFTYDELLDAIAESTSDLLVSPSMASPTQKMKLARNFAYYMQGSPDDVLEAVVKRVLLHLTTRQLRGARGGGGMLAWVRKVQTLRETENQKSAGGSKTNSAPRLPKASTSAAVKIECIALLCFKLLRLLYPIPAPIFLLCFRQMPTIELMMAGLLSALPVLLVAWRSLASSRVPEPPPSPPPCPCPCPCPLSIVDIHSIVTFISCTRQFTNSTTFTSRTFISPASC